MGTGLVTADVDEVCSVGLVEEGRLSAEVVCDGLAVTTAAVVVDEWPPWSVGFRMGGPRVPGRRVGRGIEGISYMGLTPLGRPPECLMPNMFMRLKGKRLPSGRPDEDDCCPPPPPPLNGERKVEKRLLELPCPPYDGLFGRLVPLW